MSLLRMAYWSTPGQDQTGILQREADVIVRRPRVPWLRVYDGCLRSAWSETLPKRCSLYHFFLAARLPTAGCLDACAVATHAVALPILTPGEATSISTKMLASAVCATVFFQGLAGLTRLTGAGSCCLWCCFFPAVGG